MGVELGVLTAHAQSLTLNFDTPDALHRTPRLRGVYGVAEALLPLAAHEAAVPCLLFVHMQ